MIFYRPKKQTETNKELLIKNELITKAEAKRKKLNTKNPIFERVEVSKFDTYWFFGARFQCGKGWNE